MEGAARSVDLEIVGGRLTLVTAAQAPIRSAGMEPSDYPLVQECVDHQVCQSESEIVSDARR